MQGRRQSAPSRKPQRIDAKGVRSTRRDSPANVPASNLLVTPGRDMLQPLRAAFDTLLNRAAGLLEAGGLSRREIEQALREKAHALAKGKSIRIREDASHFAMMRHVAGIMHDWSREPQFIGTDGNPKPLALNGRGSTLASLIARRVPIAQVPTAIEWMARVGAFTLDEKGRAVTQKRQVIVERGSPGPLMSERGVIMAGHALATALHNYHVKSRLPGFTDRQSTVPRLSARPFRQFRQLVRTQAGVFLETVDNWLEDHQTLDPNEDSVEAGVHVYMYKGRTNRAGKRRTRKR